MYKYWTSKYDRFILLMLHFLKDFIFLFGAILDSQEHCKNSIEMTHVSYAPANSYPAYYLSTKQYIGLINDPPITTWSPQIHSWHEDSPIVWLHIVGLDKSIMTCIYHYCIIEIIPTSLPCLVLMLALSLQTLFSF